MIDRGKTEALEDKCVACHISSCVPVLLQWEAGN